MYEEIRMFYQSWFQPIAGWFTGFQCTVPLGSFFIHTFFLIGIPLLIPSTYVTMVLWINTCWTRDYESEHGVWHTGCGVFKGGIQNYKGFWLKINCNQTKLLKQTNALSLYRSKNVLCRSKFFEPAQKFDSI